MFKLLLFIIMFYYKCWQVYHYFPFENNRQKFNFTLANRARRISFNNDYAHKAV